MNMKSLGLMSYETCSSAWTSTHINVPSRSYLCGALKQRPTTEVCASRGNSGGLGVLLMEVKAFCQSQPVAAAGGSLGVVSRHLVFRGSSFFDDESSGFLSSGAYVWSYGKSYFLPLGRDSKRSLTIAAGKKGKKEGREHVLVKEREEDLGEAAAAEEEKYTTATTTTTTTRSEDEESTNGKKKLNKPKKKQGPQQQQLENGDHAIAAAEDHRITDAQLKSKKKELKKMFQKNDVLLGQLKKKADEDDDDEDSPDEQLIENQSSSEDVINSTVLRRRESDSKKLQDHSKHKDKKKKKLKTKVKTEDLNDKEEAEEAGEEVDEASAAKDADDGEIEIKDKEKTRKLMSKLKKAQATPSVADQNAGLNEKMESNADEFADVIENELVEELDELRLDDDEFWEEDNSELEPEVGDGGEGGGVVLGDSPWSQTVLDLATDVLTEFNGELAIFAFKVFKESGVIRVRLDKLSDKYGSPTIDEIHQFSSSYSKRLEQAGEAGIIPKNLALEVSSPGAERVLHIPQDLERFKQLPMYVRYLESGEEKETEAEAKEKDGILELESVDTETGSSVWKLATVRINCKLVGKGRGLNKKNREWRQHLPFDSIRLVRLYIDL
ncbi:hypothetical protein CY35_12G048200 [Sphagnum magellanicum]|nr:hypothetical protein CY35_12G048200 [Sphagnum magellanicum]